VQQNRFRIGEAYHVEPSLNRVTGPGGVIRLEPKVMIVLCCLADHAGEMVSKERLLNAAWADVAAEHSMVLAAVPPIADLDERLDAQPELLDELAAQCRSRLLAGLQSPAWETPLADVLAST
jgi:DNA-binding response OmpR family regulator